MQSAGPTWYAITKRLNADGIKSKNERVWYGGAVSKLIKSRTVKDWLAARNNNLVTDPT